MSTVLSSVRWTFVTNVLKRAITFVLFIFIARIFTREDLGIYREFVVILSFFANISVFSFDSLFIVDQYKKSPLPFIFMVLLLTLGFGLVFSALSPVIGSYYHSQKLAWLIMWSLPILLIEAFRPFTKSMLSQNLRFKEISLAELFNNLSYSVIALAFIPFYKDIRIFVGIFYIGNLIELILQIWFLLRDNKQKIFHKFLLKSFFSFREGLEILQKKFSFLFYSTFATSLNIFLVEFPVMIFGLYYSADHIGTYFIAYQLVLVPTSFITYSVSKVFFARFSQLSLKELHPRFDKFFFFMLKIVSPLLLFYVLIMREWVEILFGRSNLSEIKTLTMLLFFRGILSLIMNPLSSMFTVLKKPHLESIWTVSSLLVMYATLHLFRGFGFMTMMAVFILLCFLIYLIFNFLVFYHIQYPVRYFISLFLRFILTSALIISLWFFLLHEITLTGYLIRPVVLTLLGLLMTGIYFYVSNRLSKGELLFTGMELIKKK